MQLSRSILIAAAVACLTPLAGNAASIKAKNLSMSIDGLDFSGFSCSMTSKGAMVSPDSCRDIQVNTITDPGTGIRISSGFMAAKTNSKPTMSFDDAVLGYHVASSTGISEIGLDFNGIYEGYAVSSVTESVFNAGKMIATASVSCGWGNCDRSAEISLGGVYNNLFVEKDIYVGAYEGFANVSIIDQTFTKAAATTPEPSSIALLGSGLIGAGLLLRRRKKVAPEAPAEA